jgi:hypothetical protein
LGLLVTTSFLGLRRYLRQRYLRMPAVVALAWLKLGGGVALVILAAALFLPRPGANQAWMALRYQIDYRLRQASQYAAKSNPPGQGKAAPATTPAANKAKANRRSTATNSQPTGPRINRRAASTPSPPAPPASIPMGQAGSIYQFLRVALDRRRGAGRRLVAVSLPALAAGDRPHADHGHQGFFPQAAGFDARLAAGQVA